MEQIAQWDRDLFIWLNTKGVDSWDSFWLFVTHIENWIPLYLLFFVLFWTALSRKRTLLATAFTFAVMGCTLGLTALVKSTVARLRPSNTPDLSDVIRILESPSDFSFWSGHSATSFAITVFVVLVLRSWSKGIYIIFIWPLLFALSRIFVGVHYPGDLLVGAVVGIIIGYTFYRLYLRVVPNEHTTKV